MIPVLIPMPMVIRFSAGQPLFILSQDLDLLERALAGQEGMIRLRQRRAPEAHDLVPDVLVQRPRVIQDEVRHGGEVQVEVVDQLLRRHALREGRESADVGEEYGQLLVHASQLGRDGSLEDLIHERRADVLAEHVADAPLVPFLENRAVGNDRQEAEEDAESRAHEGQDGVIILEDDQVDEEVHQDQRNGNQQRPDGGKPGHHEGGEHDDEEEDQRLQPRDPAHGGSCS